MSIAMRAVFVIAATLTGFTSNSRAEECGFSSPGWLGYAITANVPNAARSFAVQSGAGQPRPLARCRHERPIMKPVPENTPYVLSCVRENRRGRILSRASAEWESGLGGRKVYLRPRWNRISTDPIEASISQTTVGNFAFHLGISHENGEIGFLHDLADSSDGSWTASWEINRFERKRKFTETVRCVLTPKN